MRKKSSRPPTPLVLYLITQDWSVYSHRLSLIRETLKKGYRVVVMCHLQEHESLLKQEGVDIYPWKSIARGRLNPFYEFVSFLEVLKAYKTIKPDLVFHVSLKPVLYGTCAAKILGYPNVINLLGGLGYLFTHQCWWVKVLRQIVLKVLKFLLQGHKTYLVIQNKEDQEELKEALNSSRTLLIRGSGVDTASFQVGTRNHHPPRVIMVARLLKDKGILEYLQAVALLKTQGIKGHFFCAGQLDPANPSSLTEAEYQYWVSQNLVTFLGDQKNMPALLESMDIGLLPSYREGLPKALLECGAAGLPLVTTDVPGCREVVDGGNGFLVPPKDPQALAKALATLLKDQKLRVRLGDNSRKKIEAVFDQQIVNEQFLNLFKKVLSS